MIPFIIEQLKNNEILQAAIVAAPLATLSWAARSVPRSLFNSAKKIGSIEISFNSDMEDYQQILEYVTETIIVKKFSRNFSYHVESRYDPLSDQSVNSHKGLRLGYGIHWGFYKGRFVVVRRELIEGQQTERFKERLFLTTFSFKLSLIETLAKDIAVAVSKKLDEEYISILAHGRYDWYLSSKLPVRSLDTVFTSHGEKERLLNYLKDFESSRESYRAKGIPWHTGALLTGPPGTGKTSLIQAIASAMGRDIRYLNLGGVEDDSQLTKLVSGGVNWYNSLLVIEDADAATTSVAERKNKKGEVLEPLSLSTILNVLDGLLTPDGLIVIATTNYPEKLDAALVRSGRFDLILDIGLLEKPEFIRMARLFEVPESEIQKMTKDYKPMTGVEARSKLLEYENGRIS